VGLEGGGGGVGRICVWQRREDVEQFAAHDALGGHLKASQREGVDSMEPNQLYPFFPRFLSWPVSWLLSLLHSFSLSFILFAFLPFVSSVFASWVVSFFSSFIQSFILFAFLPFFLLPSLLWFLSLLLSFSLSFILFFSFLFFFLSSLSCQHTK